MSSTGKYDKFNRPLPLKFDEPQLEDEMVDINKLNETKERLANSLLDWQGKVQSIVTTDEKGEVEDSTALELKYMRKDINNHAGDTKERVLGAVNDWGDSDMKKKLSLNEEAAA